MKKKHKFMNSCISPKHKKQNTNTMCNEKLHKHNFFAKHNTLFYGISNHKK
jgi:hypothetical protein